MDSQNKNRIKTISLYSDAGWKKWFSKIRFWDAPYMEVERIVPRYGKIIDLGCGEGLFSNYLAISSSNRKIIGYDVDKNRICQAGRGIKNTLFKLGDATKISSGKADAVVMFHLLHHLLSLKAQEKLITASKKILNKKGKLIIVEIDKKASLKYLVTWFTDHFLFSWLFERKFYSPIYFRSKEEWMNLLEKQGFYCKIKSLEKGKPFTHILLECQRS